MINICTMLTGKTTRDTDTQIILMMQVGEDLERESAPQTKTPCMNESCEK